MKNVDSFRNDVSRYARFRPRYPAAMFEFIAAAIPGRELALDCATGSGQAAHSLAAHFDRVAAVDISPEQISLAKPHPKIEYRVGAAESVELPPGSCNLVFVGQALHWFDLDIFYPHVRQLAKKGGLFGAACYSTFSVDPGIDPIVEKELMAPIDPCWAEPNRRVFEHYATLPFPFTEIATPDFEILERWTRDQLLGYVSTWSAVKRCRAEGSFDPVAGFAQALTRRWAPEEQKTVRMRLTLRLGRVGQQSEELSPKID